MLRLIGVRGFSKHWSAQYGWVARGVSPSADWPKAVYQDLHPDGGIGCYYLSAVLFGTYGNWAFDMMMAVIIQWWALYGG